MPTKRLARAQRREDLLDAAVQLILSGGVKAVSMETVADRAGVSRPLVNKHFASKNELLTGVYRREALTIYDEVAADVRAATKLPEMYRALVGASIRASSEHGALFAAFRSVGTWNQKLRDEQRARDRETVRVFAEQARHQYGIPLPEARSATVILLAAIDPVLTQWRTQRSPADQLEETYMDIVMAGCSGWRPGPQARARSRPPDMAITRDSTLLRRAWRPGISNASESICASATRIPANSPAVKSWSGGAATSRTSNRWATSS